MPAGIDVLLRLMRRLGLEFPTPPAARVICVDDWAIRKSQRYGTIIVDHETGDVIGLLPDRTPDTLATWLKENPSIEIVSRDRAEAYAQGIKRGAPQSLQVADRWHLLKNLSEAVFRALQAHHHVAREALRAAKRDGEHLQGPSIARESAMLEQSLASRIVPTASEIGLFKRIEQTHQLRAAGLSHDAIATQLAVHPKSIRRYLSLPVALPAPRSRRRSLLDPYKAYLRERLRAGCRNATRLFKEISAQGYAGRVSILRDYVHQLKMHSHQGPSAFGGDQRVGQRKLGLRGLAWCATSVPTALSEDQKLALEAIRSSHMVLNTVIDLGQRFARLLRNRTSADLEQWLAAAAASGSRPMVSFARGIQSDLQAVRAAFELPWSNGRTEGHVNRLKCIKRSMCSRAKLDLLRIRLLAT
jgi:transposase